MDSKASITATKGDLVGEVGSISHALNKWKKDMILYLFIYHLTQTITTFSLLYFFLKK
jgi:hypothetical protein